MWSGRGLNSRPLHCECAGTSTQVKPANNLRQRRRPLAPLLAPASPKSQTPVPSWLLKRPWADRLPIPIRSPLSRLPSWPCRLTNAHVSARFLPDASSVRMATSKSREGRSRVFIPRRVTSTDRAPAARLGNPNTRLRLNSELTVVF
jgi:hypothetical protein